MSWRSQLSTRRVVLSALVALAVVVGTTSTLVAAKSHSSAVASHEVTLRSGMSHAAVRSGEVNLAALPTATPSAIAHSGALTQLPVDRQLKTPAQRAAYQQYLQTHASSLPRATGGQVSTRSPNFVGGNTIPSLVNQADGINFTQSGCGCTPPDQAIAAAPGYVFEGVNNLLEVYTPAYAQKFGPWTAQTFFGPVFHAGDFFSDPQITFDAERAVYVIAWLEIAPSGTADYIDLAISKTSTPSPLTNFREYQVPASITNTGDFCDYETLGYDYWGLWVSCVTFNGNNFAGNRVFEFNINGMLAGTLGTYAWWYNVPTDVSCGASCVDAAYRLSPTIEDGVPQAEWVIATDAGWGVTSSNLTVCAFTNTHAIVGGTLATATCDYNALPLPYDDPGNATEPGGTLYPGVGTKQITYKNGRLYFALPIAINCSGTVDDGILWSDVVPQLTTVAAANPQTVNGIVSAYSEAGYWCFTNADSFMPTFFPSTENDASLVFNISGSGFFPSIMYSGRMAVDAPGSMGQGNYGWVIQGTSSNTTGRWGDYSACALTTNLVSRGILFCAGEYGGADVWNTRLYQLRQE